MDHHIKDHFRQSSDDNTQGTYRTVIALHEAPDISWKEIHTKVPDLCKGWFELSRLSTQDRLDFTRDFWISKLPYRPNFNEFLNDFFARLDDIGIFITQRNFEAPFEAQMTYSIKNDSGFYCGRSPISEQKQLEMQKAYPDYKLPEDYIAFLQIHDGFSKTTDTTGITASENMLSSNEKLQTLLQREPLISCDGNPVNPTSLIAFYESFGMPYYQCFWGEWYPEGSMGNVYYSGEAHTISDTKSSQSSCDLMSFTTFVDWLEFYLECIE